MHAHGSSLSVLAVFALLAVAAPVGLFALGKQEERRNVRFKAIAAQPVPSQAMTFHWSKGGVAFLLCSALLLVLPCVAAIFVLLSGEYSLRSTWLWLTGLVAFALLFAVVPAALIPMLSGPAFVLDLKGIQYANQLFRWAEIASVKYSVSGGKGSGIVISLSGRKIRGPFFTRVSAIAIPAVAVRDADDFIAYANKLHQEWLGATDQTSAHDQLAPSPPQQ